MKKRRPIFKILLIVFLVLVISLAAVCIRHWNTIIAVIDGLNYSVEEIENIRIENQKEVDRELSKYPDLHFRNLTSEEITALSEGKISQDDIPYLVTGRKVYVDGEVITTEEYEDRTKSDENDPEGKADDESDKDGDSLFEKIKDGKIEKKDNKDSKDSKDNNGDKNTQGKTNSTDSKNNSESSKGDGQQNVPKTNPELEAVLQKFFVLKATFLADIESRVNGMIAEYKSHPKNQRTKALRSSYANNAISLMSQMEPQYDAQFEAVVSELSAVIEKTNGDRNLVNTVRDAYRKEKAAVKAQYVSRARKYIK
ncbi:MAG: hypothetical protein E7396_05260 [Ruminococcaceae bacterium]|nr:hypothetical protein [Oscillospiraceae bacterium]